MQTGPLINPIIRQSRNSTKSIYPIRFGIRERYAFPVRAQRERREKKSSTDGVRAAALLATD